uniref:Secreted protein n=1 Tax=Panagrolaimus superbus TaxID=310955 RepID=A0A914XW62_9BILA
MFYELLFLWWFFGSLNLTFAYNVPIDLEQITEASQTDFRLYENPYFIYVDFQTLARKQCDRQTYPQ